VRPHFGFTRGYADIRPVINAADMAGSYAICGRRSMDAYQNLLKVDLICFP
jgi:hypothetical protein